MEEETLELHFNRLLKVCLALDKNHPRIGRRWCDWSTYFNSITRKHNNYLKRLNRIFTDMCYLCKFHNLREYFLIVGLFAHCNVLNNLYSAYHPNMYHRAT